MHAKHAPLDLTLIEAAADRAVAHAAKFKAPFPSDVRRDLARKALAQEIDDLCTWPDTLGGRILEAIDGPAARVVTVLLDALIEAAFKRHTAASEADELLKTPPAPKADAKAHAPKAP